MLIILSGKLYRTRNRDLVRIYATDGEEPYPIHGAIFDKQLDCWRQESWTFEGKYSSGHSEHRLNDIVAEHRDDRQKTFFLNIYGNDRDDVVHNSAFLANACGTASRIKCVPISLVYNELGEIISCSVEKPAEEDSTCLPLV